MNAILEFEAVDYRYPAQKALALQGFSVRVPQGEKVAVVGRNGSGKSTFFMHCNGLYRPLAGTVRFRGRTLAYDRSSLRALRQRVGIVFQNPDDQLFSASVAQDISFGPLNLELETGEVRRRVSAAAALCEIADLLDRPTHALSGGEKARVALAGVLAMDPEVLIIDELLANLDPWGRIRTLGILDRLHSQGKTLLLASHDLSLVGRWATFVIVMEMGRVSFTGSLERLLTDEQALVRTGLMEVWPFHETPQHEGL